MIKSQEQFKEEVEGVLEVVRQGLAFHNGSVELVDADPVTGRVSVRFEGNCVGCSMADFTFKAGVEEVLFEMIPEVREVILVPDAKDIEKSA